MNDERQLQIRLIEFIVCSVMLVFVSASPYAFLRT
jgi:hypothetical protein